MKIITLLLLVSGLLMATDKAKAGPVGSKNIGFEKGNFDGWTGYQWRYSTSSDVPATFNTSPGVVAIPTSRRHVIISDRSGYDSNTGNQLKMIPEGYTHSARLGCELSGSDKSPRCWQQSLRYTMKVDSSNAFLLLKFACVLQYSTTHDNVSEMEPHFQLSLFDENGGAIEDCSNYDVFSSGNMDSEFKTYNPSGSNVPVKWRDWTTVGADLTGYIGEEITIEFLSADCTGHYHYGYAYFVVDCMPLYITVDYCTGDSYAKLEAPEGFEAYKWLKDDQVTVADTKRDLMIEDPKEGDTYYCVMNSETGCEVSLSSTIARYEPVADFSSKMIDCFSNEVQMINNSETNNGTLDYKWDFGEGEIIDSKDPRHKFQTSGMHDVQLIVYNPPSGCTDTLLKQVESFSPPLVGFSGDTTYCPGLKTELTAYGAYRYEWSSGVTDSSVVFGAPGGDYWMLGHSSEGCVSDTISFSILEDPEWSFTLDGDSFLCEGTTMTLRAEGALEYLWDTGEVVDSIRVYEGGKHSVTGTNARGCVKEIKVNVQEVSSPTMNFSLSTSSVNSRNPQVDCTASSEDGVEFLWDMGDGTQTRASSFMHYYTIPNELIVFDVTVTAINEWGCTQTSAASVAVDLFVPNVFTPNNDGINDLFLEDYSIKVVDRNGILLYSGNEGWNGIYKGRNADPDTYYYTVNYKDAYAQDQVKTGFITLVR
ncbi:PKD domain-containing protein [Maribellus sp. YY47]|uniref:PKD domain-containing protein n=1 Tax=Maribellus sp. YY47 TaxID=2929486 RepID=UPI0020009416|nr:PKD domain-containing protein [Maribellus sp. YY47]MCK3684842.1 PKD domain-containing protein [Maribellus sp. YY47]